MDRRRMTLAAGVLALLAAAFVVSRCADDAELNKDPEALAKAEGRERAKDQKRVRFPRDRIRGPKSDSPLATERARVPAHKAENDPILRAMASPDGGGAVFAEVNAIRHSPLVEKLLRCREQESMEAFDELKNMTGIDVLEDVDRVALGNGSVAVSGYFGEMLVPDAVVEVGDYGDTAKLYQYPGEEGPDGATESGYYAKVGDNLVVAADSIDALKASVDRVEGRGRVDGAMPPEATNSEIYGRVGKAFLESLLTNAGDEGISQLVREIVDGGVVRLDVDDHVSASIDVETSDPKRGEDLAKMAGGGLAMLRREAANTGDAELASLLEQARVFPDNKGGFGLDVAVPGETMLKMLGCDANGNPSAPGLENP